MHCACCSPQSVQATSKQAGPAPRGVSSFCCQACMANLPKAAVSNNQHLQHKLKRKSKRSTALQLRDTCQLWCIELFKPGHSCHNCRHIAGLRQ